MREDKENLIVEKTFDFAMEAIDYSEKLQSLPKYEMSFQLFRSGTSIGANGWGAQNAEGTAGFIHKFKIVAKEADEAGYWVRLCEAPLIIQIVKHKHSQAFESIIKIIVPVKGKINQKEGRSSNLYIFKSSNYNIYVR